jgi:hypothetical protein
MALIVGVEPENTWKNGGEGEIRTPGTREGSTVFETAAIDHSATSPVDTSIATPIPMPPTEPRSNRTATIRSGLN